MFGGMDGLTEYLHHIFNSTVGMGLFVEISVAVSLN